MIALALVLLACAEPAVDSGDPCADSLGATWNNWGDGFFATYCRSCHSRGTADRQGAPEGVDFDELADVVTHQDRIRHRVIEAGTMPVGGGVFADDLLLLEDLLDCGLSTP